MRTLEEIDAEIAQNEKDLGVSVLHCAEYNNYLEDIRTELAQAASGIRRRHQLDAQKKALNDEKSRRSDISFGYLWAILGLIPFGLGFSELVWPSKGSDHMAMAMAVILFIAGIVVVFTAFGFAQRAHARKPVTK